MRHAQSLRAHICEMMEFSVVYTFHFSECCCADVLWLLPLVVESLCAEMLYIKLHAFLFSAVAQQHRLETTTADESSP